MSCADTKHIGSAASDCDKDSIADNTETVNNNGSMENLNKFETKFSHRDSVEQEQNIIPWRAQLRKTNSRLSLIG